MKMGCPPEVVGAVRALCADIATPRALAVSMLLEHGEYDQLALLSTDPRNYASAWGYRNDVIVTSILRKTEDLPTSFDRKAVALDNFWESERICASTNRRLKPFIDNFWGDSTPIYDERVHELIANARKMLSSLLGPLPEERREAFQFESVGRETIRIQREEYVSRRVEHLGRYSLRNETRLFEPRSNLLEGRFGPGATYGDRGRLTTLPDKMSSSPTLTSNCMPYLFQWCGTAWASACASSKRDPTFVRGNRFTTVPKDSTKDRGIAVEPSINLFYQLGFGQYLKKRLLRAGIDLKEGQNIHRQVAREASVKGHFATLDLTNASDTVCSNLVKLLLPQPWYEALDMLRSPLTLVDGKWVKLEKFSSMGNGFTFELETLIFLVLSAVAVKQCCGSATPGQDVFVYGDDIIVPTESASSVIAVLRFFGFSLNKSKSFFEGPFRESCGGDFWNGVDVRPYFLKEFPREPQHYIAMANGLYHLGSSNPDDGLGDLRFRRAWFRILDAIPSHIRRARGPRVFGDLLIHDSKEFWNKRWRNSITYYKVYRPHTHRWVGWDHFRPSVVLASALQGASSDPGQPGSAHKYRGVLPRDSVVSFKLGWSPLS